MKLIKQLLTYFTRSSFSEVPNDFISKDELFRLKFDNNWLYSRSGNSFYSFHNEKDDLKGGLQISIIWDRPVATSVQSAEQLEQTLIENEGITLVPTTLSGFPAYYFGANYIDNNMDHHTWYIYVPDIYVKVSYFIFQEEPAEIKQLWFARIHKLLDTLEIDRTKILQTRFKKFSGTDK
jgi:hypothetical protein